MILEMDVRRNGTVSAVRVIQGTDTRYSTKVRGRLSVSGALSPAFQITSVFRSRSACIVSHSPNHAADDTSFTR